MKHQAIITKIIELWNKSSTILLSASSNLDGDALGCMFALAEIARKQGKDVVIANEKPIASLYTFLDLKEEVHLSVPDKAYDLIVTADTGALPMLGTIYTDNLKLFQNTPIVNIDHHKSEYGTLCWSTCGYENTAATMMVGRLIEEMGEVITPSIAVLLLLGIYFDTECFRNANTTPNALGYAAKLIELGADHNFLIRNMYQSTSIEYVTLYGEVLASLVPVCSGKGVIGIITPEMFAKYHVSPDGLGNEFVNHYLRSVKADFVILIKDIGEERRLSLRSKNEAFDMRLIAWIFWWGWHAMASGGRTLLSVSEIISEVNDESWGE